MNEAKNDNMSDSKEIAPRYQTQELAVLEVYGRIGKVSCKMSNLSVSGALFEILNSSFLPKKGDLIRVSINLGKLKKRYNLEAEVVWSKGLSLGVHFMSREELVTALSGRHQ